VETSILLNPDFSSHPNDPSQTIWQWPDHPCTIISASGGINHPGSFSRTYTNLRKMVEMLKHAEQIATIPLSYRSCDHGVQQAKQIAIV
jgi:hypothetical protein